jgi:hypothetical protein
MASAIPTLDLALADNPATRPALLGDLRRAITEAGFLYVVNHGVPDAVVAELFALASEAKDDVAFSAEKSPAVAVLALCASHRRDVHRSPHPAG